MAGLHVKREFRVLGFDDGPFKFGDREVLVVGVVLRAKEYVDGILSTKVRVDGLDSTRKIIDLVKKSRHFGQIRAILLNGISFGGFNVFDIKEIARETGKFVIVVIKRKPDLKTFLAAMSRLPSYRKRELMVRRAGEIFETNLRGKRMYFQCAGIDPKDAERILQVSVSRSAVPESIRLAHMIAAGIAEGESRGRP